MTKGLNEQVEEFRNRSLTAASYPVLWIDAMYEKVRYASRVSMVIEPAKSHRKATNSYLKSLRKEV